MNKEPNPHEHLPGGVTVIFLQHKGKTLRCVIDTADFDKVKDCRWRAHRGKNTLYAVTDTRGRKLRMHRLILPEVEYIDHRNGDGLKNVRENLRPASNSQNLANRPKYKNGQTSRFKGVSFHKQNKSWDARLRDQHLGCFASEEAAARAYNAAALEHFGEFAALNWLEPTPVERKPGEFIPKDNCAPDGLFLTTNPREI